MKMKIQTKFGHTVKDLTRRKAIKERCYNCSGFFKPDVRNCTMIDCHLYPYRTGTHTNSKDRNIAIRKYCIFCCANQPAEVSKCPSYDCPMWAYRKSITDRSMEIKN